MLQDSNSEIIDDENKPEIFALPVLQMVDSRHRTPELIAEIKAALANLNSTSLAEEVNHVAALIRNHPYKNAQYLLAPRQIWDIILEHNNTLPLSETFSQDQEEAFLQILSFGTDYSEEMEFGLIDEDDIEWDDDSDNLDDFEG